MKRIISLLLSAAATLTLFSEAVPAYAADDGSHILFKADFNSRDTESAYGKAEAVEGVTYEETSDGNYAARLDGSTGCLSLSAADGSPLLAGKDNIVISMRAKAEWHTGPNSRAQSGWYFYAAPDNGTQTNDIRRYTGLLDNYNAENGVQYERFNGGGWESAGLTYPHEDKWQDIDVVISENQTDLYVDNSYAGTRYYSDRRLSDILGTDGGQVFYIGKANWGSGEYLKGLIDDVAVYDFAPVIDMPDLSAVTEDIALASAPDNSGYNIEWESSDTSVISNDGKVTRQQETKDVTLTAYISYDGTRLTRQFDAVVMGTVSYSISAGDNVAADRQSASHGETVTVTVDTPLDKALADVRVNDISIFDNRNPDGSFSFIMPQEDVTVTALYEEHKKTFSFTMNDKTEAGITYTGESSAETGMSDNSVKFNGGYAALDKFPLRDSFTFSAWINPSDMGTWQRVFDFGEGTGDYIFFTVNQGNNAPRLAVKLDGNNEEIVNSSRILEKDAWAYVTVTLDNKLAKIYINGEETGSGTVNADMYELRGASKNYIGKSQYAGDPTFKGCIDEISIYNYALDAEEIKSAMTETRQEVSSVEAVTRNVTMGDAVKLPDTVKVTFANGITSQMAVTWTESQIPDGRTEGVFTVDGTVNVYGEERAAAAEITVKSDSNDSNYTVGANIIYAKNTGASYADAVFYIKTAQTDALTLKIGALKNGSETNSASKQIANPETLNGGMVYVRVPITENGNITLKAELIGSEGNIISEKTRDVVNGADFASQENIKLTGRFYESERVGLDYILGVDVARLLQPSYEMHGLELKYEEGVDTGAAAPVAGAAVERYGGWEVKGYDWGSGRGNPETLTLAGEHMGHWLSAAAVFYRDLANSDSAEDREKAGILLSRMNYMLDKLELLQNTEIPDGCAMAVSKAYIGGCPENTFTKCFAMDGTWASGYWVPWYGVHKIYQGLLDVYDYAPADTAIKSYAVLKRFSDWAVSGISGMSDSFLQGVLNTEYGGMNEIFARMGEITGSTEYTEAGRRFTHDRIIQPMIDGWDNLGGLHANTTIPKVIGAAELYEQDNVKYADYRKAGEYFWDTVVNKRSYVIGGNSIGEHFEGSADAETLGIKTCESCNTYNMMRLTEHLFSWEQKPEYMDWYEKALYNHILGQQHAESGAKMYFVSLLQGHHKIYEKKYEAWWCCTGTGMENPGRYDRVTYFEDNENNELYMNLYMPGSYTWTNAGLDFEVITDYPYSEEITVRVTGEGSGTVKFRAPAWTRNMTVTRGGDTLTSADGNEYIALNGVKGGDTITLVIPMTVRTYTPKTDGQIAYQYGPMVLAAPLGSVPDENLYTRNETKLSADCADAPYIITDGGDVCAVIDTVDKSRLLFKIKAKNSSTGEDIQLKPFVDIVDEYHCVYFNLDSGGDEYERWLNEIQLDRVEPDGQQDEVGHGLAQNAAAKEEDGGYYYDSHQGSFVSGNTTYNYRDAYGSADAFFKYNMIVNGDIQNYLFVRYWGSDAATNDGKRDFKIYVDGTEIARQTLDNNKPNEPYDVFYTIPRELTDGKDKIVVKFAPTDADCIAGGVLEMRTATADTQTKELPQSVEVTQDGRTISYSSDYSAESRGFDMYAAVYDENETLVFLKKNEANGSFTVEAGGKYIVKIFFWDAMEPVYDSITINVEIPQ